MPEGATIWSTGNHVEPGGRGGAARFTASEQEAARTKRIAVATVAPRRCMLVIWGILGESDGPFKN